MLDTNNNELKKAQQKLLPGYLPEKKFLKKYSKEISGATDAFSDTDENKSTILKFLDFSLYILPRERAISIIKDKMYFPEIKEVFHARYGIDKFFIPDSSEGKEVECVMGSHTILKSNSQEKKYKENINQFVKSCIGSLEQICLLSDEGNLEWNSERGEISRVAGVLKNNLPNYLGDGVSTITYIEDTENKIYENIEELRIATLNN